MNIFGFEIKRKKEPEIKEVESSLSTTTKQPAIGKEMPLPSADWYGAGGGARGTFTPVINILYAGEKNLGELGPAIKYDVDHFALGTRAWQLDLTSDVCHTAVKQRGRWVLGTGLRLDAEPQIDVLKMFKISLDAEKFNQQVEPLWKVYASGKIADYANRVGLHKIAKRALKNAETWGDVLVVMRVSKSVHVKVQLIDGQWVQTPVGLSYQQTPQNELVDNKIGYDFVWTNGNRVRWGVEIDNDGQHVAYHVRTGIGLQYERIPAKGAKSGETMAFLVYGSEYRLDNLRGVPRITPSMEAAKQLDDYTSATIGGAVERQRIAWYLYHEKGTNDGSPIEDNFLRANGIDQNLQTTNNGKEIARDAVATYNKQILNPTAGTEIRAIESDQEIHYKEVQETLRNTQYATMDIPPEVASMMYGGSYSASRAATNGFQYSLNIDRDDFGDQFYQPIYNLQLDIWVLTGLITAPGYLDALMRKDEIILAAYRYANWLGDPVPQIDKYKEVQAARLELGTAFDHVPLNTVQKATSDLGNGNFKANVAQAGKELEDTEAADIEPLKESPEEKEPGESKGTAKK
jgi:hypothetical protein